MTSPLRDRLRTRLVEARRARDADLAAVLRSAVAAIENAEAVPSEPTVTGAAESPIAGVAVGLGAAEVDRRVLDEEDERHIVRAEAADLRSAAEHYDEAGSPDRAAAARRHAALLERLLDG